MPRKEVVLINPEFSTLPDQGVPSGLLAVAAHTPENIPVRIINEGTEPIDFNNLTGALVGITVMTAGAPRAKEIAHQVLEAGASEVVFGGIHPTVCPQEMIEHGVVLKGEIEGGSWTRLVDDYMSNHQLDGVYESPPVSLANLPLARKTVYEYAAGLHYQQVSHARGCLMSPPCDFCTASLVCGPGLRNRPTEEVIAELKRRGLLKGASDLLTFFTSDCFGVSAGDIQLLNGIQAELAGRNIEWIAQVGIGTLNNKQFLELANSVGRGYLGVGIESPFRKGLRSVKRGIGEIDPIEVFDEVKKYPNIQTLALLMVGFDFEPKSVFEETLQYIKRLQPNGVYLSILTPLPGSVTARQLESESRITQRDWSYYDTRHLVYRPRYTKKDGSCGEWNPEEFVARLNWLVRETAEVMRGWQTLEISVR